MSEIRQIKGKNSESYEEILNKMFSNSEEPQSQIVELPSRSKFYSSIQEVVVTPLTFAEEEKILNSKGKGLDVINLILDKCVTGINLSELLQIDKLFLLMKVREVSYGTEYKFDIACPSCGDKITTKLDIAKDLNVKYVTDDFEDPRTVKLPKLGVNAIVRFPRNREESFVSDVSSFSKNLYRFVVSINGIEDPVFVAKAIQRMHIVDVKVIANEVNKGEFGLDPRFKFHCPSCDHKSMMEVPLDAGFFSVTY